MALEILMARKPRIETKIEGITNYIELSMFDFTRLRLN